MKGILIDLHKEKLEEDLEYIEWERQSQENLLPKRNGFDVDECRRVIVVGQEGEDVGHDGGTVSKAMMLFPNHDGLLALGAILILPYKMVLRAVQRHLFVNIL